MEAEGRPEADIRGFPYLENRILKEDLKYLKSKRFFEKENRIENEDKREDIRNNNNESEMIQKRKTAYNAIYAG